MAGEFVIGTARSRGVGSGVGVRLGLVLAVLAVVVVRAATHHQPPIASTGQRPAVQARSAPGGARGDWQRTADGAFDPVQKLFKGLLPVAMPWMDSTALDAAMAAAAQRFRPEFEHVRDSVAALPAVDSGPDARPAYLASATLYVEFVRVLAIGAGASGSPVQAQLRVSAHRLQILADRGYDVGRSILGVDPRGSEVDDEDTDVVVLRAPVVPDWAADGLAAGSPLASPLPPPAGPVPTPRDLVAALGRASDKQLGILAVRFDQAAGEARRRLDASGGPAVDAARGLGWLMLSEGARLGKIGEALEGVSAGRLRAVARRLVVLAEPLVGPSPAGAASGLDSRIAMENGP